MNSKHEVITFKADEDLLALLKGVKNRSEFIRTALLEALNSLCPMCKGTGVLTPHRKTHWDKLAKSHRSKSCSDCDEPILACDR